MTQQGVLEKTDRNGIEIRRWHNAKPSVAMAPRIPEKAGTVLLRLGRIGPAVQEARILSSVGTTLTGASSNDRALSTTAITM